MKSDVTLGVLLSDCQHQHAVSNFKAKRRMRARPARGTMEASPLGLSQTDSLPLYPHLSTTHHNISSSISSIMGPKCVIDRTILNESTIARMDDIGLSFFAKLCGNNRGAFVVDPPDGNTYG